MENVGLGSERFKASSIIVVYSLVDNASLGFSILDQDSRHPHYLQVHRVENGKICEGRPLKVDELRMISKSTAGGGGSCEILPAQVIAYDPGVSMHWYIPAGRRHINFARGVKLQSGEAPLPALLFGVSGDKLNVWALASSERPTAKTPVYHAPFFNITNSLVCMGNVEVPNHLSVKYIDKWVSLFFRSRFTAEGQMRLKGIKPVKLWAELISSKHEVFPTEYLVKAGTVTEIVGEGVR